MATDLIALWINGVKPYIDWTLKLKETEDLDDHNPWPDI